MQVQDLMIKKAKEYLESGKVDRVIGYKKGESFYDNSPATFTLKDIDELVYNGFCGINLSKYLVKESKKDGKVLIFLKPCDTFSFNQLLSEHRIDREKIVVIGVECQGMLSERKLFDKGLGFISSITETPESVTVTTADGEKTFSREELALVKCETCKSKEFALSDETIVVNEMKQADGGARFELVKQLEGMTEEQRFAFWQDQLSKCIRCNACRNVCPACTCINCVFDNDKSGVAGKANTDQFEEKLYHIIRAYHVAGRCTDCGECSSACPQGIPLHLINRKFIKDINENYGDYQAGAIVKERNPVVDFTTSDVEANEAVK